MWRRKKLMVAVVLATVVLAGSIGGVVLAQENEDSAKPGARHEVLLDRVIEIYEQDTGMTIDREHLENAFAQAYEELRGEMPDGMPHRGLPLEALEKLGIAEQDFLAAVDQALNELGDETPGPEHHKAVMDRVMEILGVDEADWQQAMTELREAHGHGFRSGMPPHMPFRGGGFNSGGAPPASN